jgi:predicted O-methyltransferase YrrM
MDAADEVLREIEKIGEKKFIPSIGPVKGKVLAEVIQKTKPKRIVEVGALYGYSSILMAKNAPKAKITTIEVSPEHVRITRENVRRAGMDDRIEVLQGDGTQALSKLTGSFDLVFLDAAKEEYLAYLKAVEKKLHKGSIVVADNVGVFADQMKDFLDYIRNSDSYKSRTVETGLEYSGGEDAMEISEKIR